MLNKQLTLVRASTVINSSTITVEWDATKTAYQVTSLEQIGPDQQISGFILIILAVASIAHQKNLRKRLIQIELNLFGIS